MDKITQIKENSKYIINGIQTNKNKGQLIKGHFDMYPHKISKLLQTHNINYLTETLNDIVTLNPPLNETKDIYNGSGGKLAERYNR